VHVIRQVAEVVHLHLGSPRKTLDDEQHAAYSHRFTA